MPRNDAIHCIWYCINVGANRTFDATEIAWLKELTESNKIAQDMDFDEGYVAKTYIKVMEKIYKGELKREELYSKQGQEQLTKIFQEEFKKERKNR